MSVTVAAVVLMMGSAVPDAATIEPVANAVAPQVAAKSAAPPSSAAVPTVLPADPAAPAPVNADQAVQSPAPGAATPQAEAGTGDDVGEDPASEIVVRHRKRLPGDPMENVNAESFKVTQAVDKAVLEPVATAYNKGLPRPVRQGLRNFFNNLDEPAVFLAYMLQLKPGKAAETAGRFAINTTLGVGGLVDVAKRKPFNLPYRPNGLANVMGYYGIGPGPYMYLPIVGPTTVRDLIGDSVDNLLLVPALVGKPLNKPEVALPMTVVSQLGERAAFDDQINKIRKTDDPYATYRDLYLRQRKAEIDALHGRATTDVVPVYGPGLRTAGGKKKPKESGPEAGPAVSPETTTPSGPATEPAVTPPPVEPETSGPEASGTEKSESGSAPAATQPQPETQP